MSSANASTSEVADTSNQPFPVYYDGSGSIQSMTLQDMKDTIFEPTIDLLTSGSTGTQQGGTYFISTSTSVSGATEVSGANTAVFTDTRSPTHQLMLLMIFLKHLTNQLQLLTITYIKSLAVIHHTLRH